MLLGREDAGRDEGGGTHQVADGPDVHRWGPALGRTAQRLGGAGPELGVVVVRELRRGVTLLRVQLLFECRYRETREVSGVIPVWEEGEDVPCSQRVRRTRMLSKVGERPKAGSGCSRSGAARFFDLGAALALVGGCDMEILLFVLPFLVFDDAAV